MPIRDHSLLVMAAWDGKLERIDQLLRAGANVEARDSVWNPLHAAIENSHPDAVRLLLERGANPIATVEGLTPLCYALDLEWDFASNNTPFELPTPESSAILLEYGADPNGLCPGGESLLAWVRTLNYPKAVEMLVAAGAR